MKMDKRKKADLLLTELGEIDDRLVSEALTYGKRRKRRILPVIAGIAAMLVLFFGILPHMARSGKNSPGDPPLSDLYTLLSTYEPGELAANGQAVAEGTARIAYSIRGEEDIYYIDLSSAEYKRLISLSSDDGKKTREGESKSKFMLWLISDGGEVYSPHLAHTKGNISHRDLYYYESEYTVSAAFERYICSIIKSRI